MRHTLLTSAYACYSADLFSLLPVSLSLPAITAWCLWSKGNFALSGTMHLQVCISVEGCTCSHMQQQGCWVAGFNLSGLDCKGFSEVFARRMMVGQIDHVFQLMYVTKTEMDNLLQIVGLQ